ncbi:hypothetical protein DPEC_G00164680 [Dallia pectoralis]|uniref:Uncharacterized protein n=1 Tax=Dallia pectoralis TaxID=75939 RepID=A0ACC2GH40_DALPE|nr:hypothetical protein DPEC_G00164680 [Dallia pectoralis]
MTQVPTSGKNVMLSLKWSLLDSVAVHPSQMLSDNTTSLDMGRISSYVVSCSCSTWVVSDLLPSCPAPTSHETYVKALGVGIRITDHIKQRFVGERLPDWLNVLIESPGEDRTVSGP